MPFIETSKLTPKEPLPGWSGRFFHSTHMTFSYYDIEPGTPLHLHHHPEEEVWHVVEGELEMAIGDVTRIVRAGEAAIVPANVAHRATAHRRCRAIVVDSPVRTRVGGVDIG